ncbi:hypothetical protein VCHA31O73_360044 [Vibrio chagasii]|nr:hypothetical protein VCHA31O73_360044 [Vibrio chagasii]
MSNIFDKSQLELRSNPNLLINGDFSVWQRGVASSSPKGGWGADRWKVSGFSAVAKSNHGNPDNPISTRNVMTFNKTTSNASAFIDQAIENGHWLLYGKIITVSGSLAISDVNRLNNIQVINHARNAVLGNAVPTITPMPNQSGWFTFEATFAVTKLDTDNSDHAYLRLAFDNEPSNGWLSELKLELGSVATPFVPDDPATNLAKCQRYLYKINNMHHYTSANGTAMHYMFPIYMRVDPSITVSLGTVNRRSQAWCTVTGMTDGDQFLTADAEL